MRVSEVSESTRQHTCDARVHYCTGIAQCTYDAHAAHTQRTRSAHAAHAQRTRSARERWVGGHRTSEAFLQGGPCPSAAGVVVLSGGLKKRL